MLGLAELHDTDFKCYVERVSYLTRCMRLVGSYDTQHMAQLDGTRSVQSYTLQCFFAYLAGIIIEPDIVELTVAIHCLCPLLLDRPPCETVCIMLDTARV